MTEQNTTPEARHKFVWADSIGLSEDGICECGQGEHAPVHDPETKVTHVVIGLGYYGNGTSEASAKAAFRKAGGRLSGRHSVIEFPDGVVYLGVTNMGVVRWRVDVEGAGPVVSERNMPQR